MISGINPETQSATVEWFEKGETKGKEVNLRALLLTFLVLDVMCIFKV